MLNKHCKAETVLVSKLSEFVANKNYFRRHTFQKLFDFLNIQNFNILSNINEKSSKNKNLSRFLGFIRRAEVEILSAYPKLL